MDKLLFQTKRLISISLLSVIVIIVGYFCRYGVNVLLARILGASSYGDWAVLIKVVLFCAFVFLIGADDAALVFIPKYLADREWGKIKGFIKRHLQLIFLVNGMFLLLSSVVIAVLFIFPGLDYTSLLQLHPVVFGFWFIPLMGLIYFNAKLLRSLQRIMWSLVPYSLLLFVVFGLSLLLFMALFHKITIYHILFTFGFILVAIVVLQVAALYSFLPKEVFKAEPVFVNKAWMQVSSKLMVANILYRGFDVFIIVILEVLGKTDAEVGVFAAISVIAWSLLLVVITMNIVLSSLIGLAVAKKEKQELQQFVNKTSIMISTIVLTLSLIIIIFGKSILGYFGAGFVIGYVPLVIVVVGYMVSACLEMSLALLRYTKYQRTVINGNIAALLVMIVLGIILVPTFNLYGAAISLCAARIIMSLWYYIAAKRKFGINPFISFKFMWRK